MLTTIWSLGDFNSVYLLTGGGPADLTHVLATLGIRYLRLDQVDLSMAAIVVAMPLVACRIVGVSLPEYYAHTYLRPALAIAPFAAAAWWVRASLPASNLAVFFLQMIALVAIYLPCAFFIVLNARERRFVLERMGVFGRRQS